jgi:hypothetical protein
MNKEQGISEIRKRKEEINSKMKKGHRNLFGPALLAAHSPPGQTQRGIPFFSFRQ